MFPIKIITEFCNDYSSIKCFGTITGIDQINHVFYISVGTNPIITFFIQSIFGY